MRVMFVYVQNCVRIACAGIELQMCCYYEYKTMNAPLVQGPVQSMPTQNVTWKFISQHPNVHVSTEQKMSLNRYLKLKHLTI